MTSSEITHMQPCPDFYHVEFFSWKWKFIH